MPDKCPNCGEIHRWYANEDDTGWCAEIQNEHGEAVLSVGPYESPDTARAVGHQLSQRRCLTRQLDRAHLELHLLAALAAGVPAFDADPMHCEAVKVRDRILKETARG